MEESCLTCRFMRRSEPTVPVPVCHRFPKSLRKEADDWCGEYRSQPPEEETLRLAVADLGLNTTTVRRLRSCNIYTLEDLLDLGKRAVCKPNGLLDRPAINDIVRRLAENFSIKW